MKIFSQNKPIVYKLWSITNNLRVYFYNGTSWSLVYTAPNPAGSNYGCCWKSSTENDFWCSFGKSSNNENSYIYHYNGSTWSSQLISLATVYGFWGVSSNDLWALAMPNSDNSQFWHFDGISWTKIYEYPTLTEKGRMTFLCGSAANLIWCGRSSGYYNGWKRWQLGYNGSFVVYDTTGISPDLSLSVTRSAKFNTYDNKFYVWAGNGNSKMYVFSHSNAINGIPWAVEQTIGDSISETATKKNNSLHVYRDKIWACQNDSGAPSPIWYYNGSIWTNVSSGSGTNTTLNFLEGHQENIWIGGKHSLGDSYAFVAQRSSLGVWTIWNFGLYNVEVMDTVVVPT